MTTENNTELQQAWDFAEHTGISIFLTGKAGTGKTTFLRHLKEAGTKRMAVVAPTGVAAINAGGQTIHSFFQLPLSPYVPNAKFQEKYEYSREKRNILRTLDLLVIDEISMVRADLLDAVDNVLRRFRNPRLPFGGVQLLMIGDLQQLAPVVTEQDAALIHQYYDTPFFFGSKALSSTPYVTIELKHVYRQSDEQFLNILNSIREGKANDTIYNILNARCRPDFHPRPEEGYIRLTTHNALAQRYNENELKQLKTPAHTFQALIEGTFPEYAYPTDVNLTLKEGAQVMFVKNDTSNEHLYYNGKIGRVAVIDDERITVRCPGDDYDIEVEPAIWENAKYALNEQTKEIEAQVQGTFQQYPLRTAWAITIHKSQGLTFERAIIDAQLSFASGQVYVALSRCKTLEGMVLASPISGRSVIQDERITSYITGQEREAQKSIALLPQLKEQYFARQLCDLFDFTELRQKQERLCRVLDEHFFGQYPELSRRHQTALLGLRELIETAAKWQSVISKTSAEGLHADAFLQRVMRSANYFGTNLQALFDELLDETEVESINKQVRKQFDEALYDLRLTYMMHVETLQYVEQEGFDVSRYLRTKNRATLEAIDRLSEGKKSRSKGTKRKTATENLLYPELYHLLAAWREQEARRREVNPAIVMQQRALVNVVNMLPGDLGSLAAVPYVSKQTAKKYGAEMLPIIIDFCRENHLKPAATTAVKQQAEKKQPAKDTKQVSLDLFRQGKNVIEIAAERGYTPDTIFRHLSHFVLRKELPVEALVSAGQQEAIRSAIERIGKTGGLTPIKEACPPDVTYNQIRLMLDLS